MKDKNFNFKNFNDEIKIAKNKLAFSNALGYVGFAFGFLSLLGYLAADTQNKFIPYLVDLSSKRQIHPLNIANKDFIISFTERCCDRVEWQWDDFNSEAWKVRDSVLLLYWFPEPTTPPLAKFAAAVVSESGLIYYTLEYDDYDGRSVWYLCTQDAQKHYNIGQVEECATMEDFVRLLQDKVLDA